MHSNMDPWKALGAPTDRGQVRLMAALAQVRPTDVGRAAVLSPAIAPVLSAATTAATTLTENPTPWNNYQFISKRWCV